MNDRIKNLGNKANTAGFDKNPQNINRNGRPPSIRRQLQDLLESEGSITIPSNQVVQINEDGSVILDMPTQMQLAVKLASWAMSEEGNNSLRAIKMIMEQIDGKPEQVVKTDYTSLTDEELEDEIKALEDELGE